MNIELGMPPAGHVSPMGGNMGGAGGGMGMGRGGPGMGVGMRGPQVGPGGPGGGPGVGGMGGMPGNMGRGGPGGNQPNQFVPQNMASTEQAREHAMRQMQYFVSPWGPGPVLASARVLRGPLETAPPSRSAWVPLLS